MDSRAESKKALVLEAFNTLFNKRDYDAAETFWSPGYTGGPKGYIDYPEFDTVQLPFPKNSCCGM